MAKANSFGSNHQTTVEKRQRVITITQKTVRFSDNVYQTHNITGFSEGTVDIETIPWWIIILVFVTGLILCSSNNRVAPSTLYATTNNIVGLFLILASIGGTTWKVTRPRNYGLLLTFNSGHQTLFVTTDRENLKQAVIVIYDFIEEEKNAIYQIDISNSSVRGNLIQGNGNKL